ADWVFVPFHGGLRLSGMGEISPSSEARPAPRWGRLAEGELAPPRGQAGARRLGGTKSDGEEIGSSAVEDKQLRLPPRAPKSAGAEWPAREMPAGHRCPVEWPRGCRLAPAAAIVP